MGSLNDKPNKCRWCGKLHHGLGRFCSQRCRTAYDNSIKEKVKKQSQFAHSAPSFSNQKNCIHCRKPFSYSAYGSYCSRACEIRGEKRNEEYAEVFACLLKFSFWAVVAAIGIAILLFVLYLVFSPGMVITSLFTNWLNNSWIAWILSILFSAGIFALIFFLLKKSGNIEDDKLLIYTAVIYVVISGLSVWLLWASNADMITRINQLLLWWFEK